MDCRGHNNRIKIVEKWNLKPIAHLKLINGKIIPGDAGGMIKDAYYIFECINKNDESISYIHCGKTVAMDFAEIINEPLPKIFNPLKSDTTKVLSYSSTSDDNSEKWNTARKQLYNAVMLLIIAWNANEGTALFDIKEKIEMFPQIPPPLFLVKAVNTILSRGNKKMIEVIERMKIGNDFRDFEFDLLVDILKSNGIKQYFI